VRTVRELAVQAQIESGKGEAMIRSNEDEAFWPSYVDLMTGLFVITLVLFVFSYRALSMQRDRLKVSADNYRRLQEIDAAIKELADAEHFEYQPEFKRYVFRRQVQFARGDDNIAPEYYGFLRQTGEAIASLVKRLKEDPEKRGIRYLVLIEGMASKDNYPDNFGLSYRRALALYTFWRENHISFDPALCEVAISGSGTEGIGRYSGAEEVKNQRFLIQILPKVAY
jgi:outer membrane protein OmpA-like peptidoglycan-associated protein